MKVFVRFILGILLGVGGICGGIAGLLGYSGIQRERAAEATRTAILSPDYCPPDEQRPGTLVLTGRVSDTYDNVPNGYLVLLYRGAEEAGRATTESGQHTYIEGVTDRTDDGYFEIRTENTSRLAPCDFDGERMTFQVRTRALGDWLVGWRDELDVDAHLTLDVPEKNFSYTLVVLPAPVPADVLENPTELTAAGVAVRPEDLNTPLDLASMGVDVLVERTGEQELVPIAGTLEQLEAANCAGNNVLTQRYAKSQAYSREFSFDFAFQGDASGETSANVPLEGLLNLLDISPPRFEAAFVASLESTLGIDSSVQEVREFDVPVEFPPGQHLLYEVQLFEVWEPHTATVQFMNAGTPQTFSVDFRVKAGVRTFQNSQAFDCP